MPKRSFAKAAKHGRRPVAVTPLATRLYPTPAGRPSNSRLDTHKLATVYGVILPSWRSSLPGVVARLLKNR
nr:sugar nucleotide-binding protein [Methylocystis sp. B8]